MKGILNQKRERWGCYMVIVRPVNVFYSRHEVLTATLRSLRAAVSRLGSHPLPRRDPAHVGCEWPKLSPQPPASTVRCHPIKHVVVHCDPRPHFDTSQSKTAHCWRCRQEYHRAALPRSRSRVGIHAGLQICRSAAGIHVHIKYFWGPTPYRAQVVFAHNWSALYRY